MAITNDVGMTTDMIGDPAPLPDQTIPTEDGKVADDGSITTEQALRVIIEGQIMQDLAAKYKAEEIDGGVWEPGPTAILRSF